MSEFNQNIKDLGEVCGRLVGRLEIFNQELDPSTFGEFIGFKFVFEVENEAHVLYIKKSNDLEDFFVNGDDSADIVAC